MFVTKHGQVKRTLLSEYATNRLTAGQPHEDWPNGDEVMRGASRARERDLLLVTKLGMSIRFKENEVNAMGQSRRRRERHSAERGR